MSSRDRKAPNEEALMRRFEKAEGSLSPKSSPGAKPTVKTTGNETKAIPTGLAADAAATGTSPLEQKKRKAEKAEKALPPRRLRRYAVAAVFAVAALFYVLESYGMIESITANSYFGPLRGLLEVDMDAIVSMQVAPCNAHSTRNCHTTGGTLSHQTSLRRNAPA